MADCLGLRSVQVVWPRVSNIHDALWVPHRRPHADRVTCHQWSGAFLRNWVQNASCYLRVSASPNYVSRVLCFSSGHWSAGAHEGRGEKPVNRLGRDTLTRCYDDAAHGCHRGGTGDSTGHADEQPPPFPPSKRNEVHVKQ